jgi:hypothetical protein
MPSDSEATIAGVIISIKKILTKKNETMMFVKIEDGVDSTEILVFPKLLKETLDIWQSGKVIMCAGTVSDKDNETKLLANKAVELNLENLQEAIAKFKAIVVPARNNFKKNWANKPDTAKTTPVMPLPQLPPLKLIIDQTNLSLDLMNDLKQVCLAHPGSSKVFIKFLIPTGDKVIEAEEKVEVGEELIKKINEKFEGLVRVV